MYIQITTKCNMSCPHCIFSCKQGAPGDFMTPEVFKKAVRLHEDHGDHITIGGGEPTLHPKFWEFFGEAMAAEVEYVWMATNGSVKKIAKALAGIASGSDKFDIALSQDSYHDPIDWSVVRTFERLNLEIRNNDDHIINKGAAYDNGVGTHDGCGCSTIQIKPDGSMYMCGCPESLKIGHIDSIEDWKIQRVYEVGEETDNCGDNLPEDMIAYIQGDIDEFNTDYENVA